MKMDPEYKIIQHVRGPIGMNHVRCIGDLYSIRQETLEKRLTAAVTLSPESVVSVYAEWMQYRLLSDQWAEKLGTREKRSLVASFCSFALSSRCSKRKRNAIWKAAVNRALAHAGKSDKIISRVQQVQQDLQAWFDKADIGGPDFADAHDRGTLGSGPGRDERPPQDATHAYDQRKEEEPSHIPVNDWGNVPDELYQCPNCSEVGQHFHDNCPKTRHLRGNIVTQEQYAEQDRRRDEASRARKAQVLRWADMPPTNYRCGLCDKAGDHWEDDCPDKTRHASSSWRDDVGDRSDYHQARNQEMTIDVLPTTENRAEGSSLEPGEISERQALKGSLEFWIDKRGKKRCRPASGSGEGHEKLHNQGGRLRTRKSSHVRSEMEFTQIEPLSKRLRLRDEETNSEFPIDNARGWGCQRPTAAETRIDRWRSEIQSPDSEDTASIEIRLETGKNSRNDPMPGVDTNAGPSAALRKKPDLNAATVQCHASNDLVRQPDSTNVPPEGPTRNVERLQTVDITTRPKTIALRTQCKTPVAETPEFSHIGDVVDLTEMISAREEAEGFLASFPATDGSQMAQRSQPHRETHSWGPRDPSSLNPTSRAIVLDGMSSPHAASSEDFFSCEDNFAQDTEQPREDPLPGLGRGRDHVNLAPSSQGSPIERQDRDSPSYDRRVIELFRGEAPPQVHVDTRTTAVGMWERADALVMDQGVAEDEDDEPGSDDHVVQIKREVEEGVSVEAAWFDQAPSSSEYSSSEE